MLYLAVVNPLVNIREVGVHVQTGETVGNEHSSLKFTRWGGFGGEPELSNPACR